jgi:myo-inositol-1(or 4)-monophosphatase
MTNGANSRQPLALARVAERAAAGAATFLLTAPRPAPGTWTTKGHHDFVTDVDRHAEALITRALVSAYPSSRVLGEEFTPDASSLDGLVWVVDPLDGTTNFLHGYPWWSVSIAAAIDGDLVAGTVFNVPAHRRYTAWRGGGAWSGGNRLRVSRIEDPAQALVGTGFPFKSIEDMPTYLEQCARIFPATSGVRRAGSAALDLVSVATGEFEAFWELTLAPWDKAAGTVLIREAGGVITNIDGSDAGIAHGGVVAGNPAMHAWLQQQL